MVKVVVVLCNIDDVQLYGNTKSKRRFHLVSPAEILTCWP